MNQRPHYPFLDAIRGIAAIIVVLDHGAWPYSAEGFTSGPFFQLGKVLMNGPWAVMVFFVISGFCIHLPNQGRVPQALPFLYRRLIRITLPLAGASVLSYMCDFRWFHLPMGSAIVWSLWCEIAYYIIYAFGARWLNPNPKKWLFVTLGAYGCALLVAWMGRGLIEYPRRELWAVIVLGLPVWLSGVLAAEFIHKGLKLRRVYLWGLHCTVLCLGAVCTVAKFKFDLSYAVSLTLMAPILPFWLVWSINSNVMRVFVPLGTISYSLYLVHQPLLGLNWPDWNPLLLAGYKTAVCLGVAVIFYALIESPSHRLARRVEGIKGLKNKAQ